MKCPSCQVDAPADAEFCPDCGAKLLVVCAECGTQNVAGHRFCKRCGQAVGEPHRAGSEVARFGSPHSYTPHHLAEKILTSRSVLEGERKLVTVLFVDVSGFTALSEKLDPEDVHQLMDRAFELMLAEVHRYEGTVNQFLGDGLMALFGAPIAHEDHPVRAGHAALGIQRALAAYRDQLRAERGIDFQVRMGLNTGAVVVGKIGDNLRMDYTAVGDTTNVAARFLALAEPGQILISEETSKVVGPYFLLQPLGEVIVKGKALPVRAFRVEAARGVRSRIEAESERGLTPLVGRDREVALLQDRFAEAQAGRGQAVFVFGEAGIGKSRLLLEFRRYAESAGARWLLGRCVSFGRGISYLPVLDVVRDLLGIKEGDRAETIIEKVEAGVREIGDELAWTAPFVRSLLSLDPGDATVAAMPPIHRRGRTGEALRALIIRESQRRLLVLVVEDLHWIDPHSEEVLRLLLEGLAATPLLLMLTYRPGYTLPFGDQTYYTRVTLHALPASQIGVMVDRVLGTSDVPAAVRDLIAGKAEGNPLFIEELSKALVEDGTLRRANGGYQLARPLGEVAVPDTIQGVIMARIDRLPEASKSALQIASVIGREFTARLVERVSAMEREATEALGELRAVELIYEKATYPELAYMFKHALTHDVAYESLLRQRRRALHQRVGEVIEELYPDRLAEFYEMLAFHYVQGEAWPKAVDYLLKAADKARARFAYAEATRFCKEAIEVLDRHGGAGHDRLRAFEVLGDLESLQGDVDAANRAYVRAAEVSEEPATRQRIANKHHRAGVVVRDVARIAFYEHGTGEPTLVFLHPIVYGLATYQPLLEVLCQEYRIVTVDPRGVGGSDPVTGPYFYREHVEDIRAVIEAIGNRPVVFIGISQAGNIGVNFAAKYPHLVERLVVIGTPPCPVTDADYPVPAADREWRVEMVKCVEADDYDRATEIFLSRVISEPGTRNLLELSLQYFRALPRQALRNFFKGPLTDPDFDIRPFLPTLRVPTLVLHGELDEVVPAEAGRWIAGQIPGAQFYAFAGKGHRPQYMAPAEFAQVLRSFIRIGGCRHPHRDDLPRLPARQPR